MMTETIDTELAALIDHTLLKADAGERSILQLCNEARQYGFASVCIHPTWVRLCASMLDGAPPAVCTVIGFPLGANRTEIKMHETEAALADGATEFDMVMHLGRLKEGDHAYVEQDIRQVVQTAKAEGESAIVKVILETCLLTEAEIREASLIALGAGADFVKTSTGFSTGGATEEAIRLMRQTVGDGMGVKASGGIRTRDDARSMIAAGASRIGASASVNIVQLHTA